MDPTNLLQPPQMLPVQPPGAQTQASPEELRAMYEYSRALQSNQMPVRSWTQGVSNMVNALMGGMVGNRADALAREGQGQAIVGRQGSLPLPPTSSNAVYDGAPSEKKTAPQGGALNLAPTGGSDLIDRAQSATAKQESGGDYGAVGPNTKYGPALGKYQIVRDNIGPWSREVLGKEFSPQEFLKDPAAQDAIYRAKMGQYVQKYGIEGAGRAWLGGEGGVTHPERRDVLGTSVGDYGKRFAGLVGGQSGSAGVPQTGPGPATAGMLAFNGQPAGPAAGAGGVNGTDAIVMALQGGKAASGAAKPGAGGQVVQAPTGQYQPPIVPPAVLPGQSRWTPQSLSNFMMNRFVDPAQKAAAYQEYMGSQVSPQVVPALGGRVLISPTDRSQQYYIPDVHWTERKSPTGAATQMPQVIAPTGATKTLEEPSAPKGAVIGPTSGPPPPLPPNEPIILPEETTPAVPPPAAPPPAPPAGPASGKLPFNIQGQAAPPAGALAFNEATASDAVSPAAQAATAAGAKPPGPAETPAGAIAAAQGAVAPNAIPAAEPPKAAGVAAPMGAAPMGPLAAPPPAQPAGKKTAESYEDWNRRMTEEGLDYESRKADIPIYQKASQQYMDIGIRAGKALPSLQAASQLVKDPRYYSGVLADPYTWIKKGKAALAQELGIGDDKAAAAPIEIFDKILSGNIVTELKTMLGGLGQIRLAEINLITQSVANKFNTPKANAAVLMMMQREAVQASRVGTLAEQYAKGWVLNDKDQWVPRTGLTSTAGLEGEVSKYTQRHPLLSDSEISNIQNTFNIAQQQGKATANPNAPAEKTKAELMKAAKLDMGGTAEAATATPAAAQTATTPAAPASKVIRYDAQGNRLP